MKIRGGRVPTGLLRRQLDVVEERIRSATSLEALMTMEWPGNVRELRMVLTSAAVRAPGREIDLRHLPAEYRGAGTRRHLGSLGSEPPPGGYLRWLSFNGKGFCVLRRSFASESEPFDHQLGDCEQGG